MNAVPVTASSIAAIMTPSMSLTTMSNSATCKWPPLLEIPPDDNMCTTATP